MTLDAGVCFYKRADIGKSNRVRKLTPLKVIGFAFRKDKGTFISGSKENKSCAGGCEGDGRGIAPTTIRNQTFAIEGSGVDP